NNFFPFNSRSFNTVYDPFFRIRWCRWYFPDENFFLIFIKNEYVCKCSPNVYCKTIFTHNASLPLYSLFLLIVVVLPSPLLPFLYVTAFIRTTKQCQTLPSNRTFDCWSRHSITQKILSLIVTRLPLILVRDEIVSCD